MDPLGPVTDARIEITTMADDIRTVLKNFNPALLEEELTASALPFVSVFLAGFISAGQNEVQPSPTPRVITRDGVAGTEDLADPGEIRFVFTTALTVAEGVVLDNLLTAHGSTGTTSEQDREAQDVLDLDQLITDLPNVTTMTNVQFQDHVQRMTRVLVRELKSPPPAV